MFGAAPRLRCKMCFLTDSPLQISQNRATLVLLQHVGLDRVRFFVRVRVRVRRHLFDRRQCRR